MSEDASTEKPESTAPMNQDRPDLWSLFQNSQTKFYVIISILYVFGFIITASFALKFGYIEENLFSPRYFISGGLFFLFLLSYAIPAGRFVIEMKDDLQGQIVYHRNLGLGNGWIRVVAADHFFRLSFYLVLSTTVYCSLFLSDNIARFISPVIFLIFFIRYHLDVTNFDIKHPRVMLIIHISYQVFFVPYLH